jgi:hypothetical protein
MGGIRSADEQDASGRGLAAAGGAQDALQLQTPDLPPEFTSRAQVSLIPGPIDQNP